MTRKRLCDEAIICQLIEQGSIKGAAAALGCTVRTLYDRMKAPEFAALYSRARADLLRAATTRLQGHLEGAIDTLADIMNDNDTARQTRVNAATTILQYAARFTEATDILERLEAIEDAQAQMNANCL